MKRITRQIFQPIEPRRTFKEISEKIKQAIFKGTLKPGDRLPSEVELARQFNVARQTVREALRLLEMSGFITVRRGSNGGPIIENTVLHAATDAILNAIQLQDVSLADLTAARLEIEKGVLRHVVRNADESDIEMLQKNIIRAKEKVSRGVIAFFDNVEFHKLLAKASKNPLFAIVVESIMAVGADYITRIKPALEPSKKTVYEHEAILEAIIETKTEKAIHLLEDHLMRIGHLNREEALLE